MKKTEDFGDLEKHNIKLAKKEGCTNEQLNFLAKKEYNYEQIAIIKNAFLSGLSFKDVSKFALIIQGKAVFNYHKMRIIAESIKIGLSEEQVNLISKIENNNPYFREGQMVEIRMGFLPKKALAVLCSEQPIPLSMDKVKVYAKKEFNALQMEQMLNGFRAGFSIKMVQKYANPNLHYQKMSKIREDLAYYMEKMNYHLKEGDFKDLSSEDKEKIKKNFFEKVEYEEIKKIDYKDFLKMIKPYRGWIKHFKEACEAFGFEYKDEGKLALELALDGDANACYQVGRYYAKGRGGLDWNEKQAFQFFKKGAELGHGGCQYELAGCYNNGWGVAVNYEKTVAWLEKAVANNEKQAFFVLGEAYFEGNVVKKNKKKAIDIFKKGMSLGCKSCKDFLEKIEQVKENKNDFELGI